MMAIKYKGVLIIAVLCIYISLLFSACNNVSHNNREKSEQYTDSLLHSKSAILQPIPIDSEKKHFVPLGGYTYAADMDNFHVYHDSNSVYVLYRFGGTWEPAYECDAYNYPLEEESGKHYNSPYKEDYSYKRSKFLKRLREVRRIKGIKEAIYIDQFNRKDSIAVTDYLHGKTIRQMANPDSANLLVLTRDTATYKSYLISYNRIHKKVEQYLYAGPACDSLYLLFANLSGNSTMDLILCEGYTGDSHMGNFYSYFYMLKLNQ